MNMLDTIVAKSDQINAADLIGAPMTVKIAGVKFGGDDGQPVSLSLEGMTKVWRPCKGMRRVLVYFWGPDASVYVGRSVTLFHAAHVKWAGKPEGGIRISHMSHIEEKQMISVRESKAVTRVYEIEPLRVEHRATSSDSGRTKAEAYVAEQIAAINAALENEALAAIEDRASKALAKLATEHPDLHEKMTATIADRRASFAPVDDYPFGLPPIEGRPETDQGEATTLESAKAEIDAAEIVADVNARVAALLSLLSEEDGAELREYAIDAIASLKAGK